MFTNLTNLTNLTYTKEIFKGRYFLSATFQELEEYLNE
jgi:hypothetical protein